MSQFLHKLCSACNVKKRRERIINEASLKELNSIRNLCYNLCKKKFKLPNEVKRKILPYKKDIRDLANSNKLKTSRGLKNRMTQQGGFLPVVLPILLGLLSSVGTDLLGKAIGI